MDEFKVHRVRFFEYVPSPIHCMAYDFDNDKLAVSRANNYIEIWNIKSRWFLEKTISPMDVESIEALCWCKGRLFSAGLHGFLKEYDLAKLCIKRMVSSNHGAIWCMTKNEKQDVIAVGTEEGAVVLFNLTSDTFDYERAFEKQDARIFTLAWYHPEDLIVTGSVDNIRVWSVASGRAIQRMSLARCATNQETIVWSITICRNFTVVSGDSRGITSFWNGHRGTLIKAFNYHKADVLSLISSPSGNTVYSAGIDPCIVKFEYLPVTNAKKPAPAPRSTNSDGEQDDDYTTVAATAEVQPWSQWIRTMVHTQHTHDIRSLVTTKDKLFSGGVDCQLVCNDLGTEHRVKSKKKFASVPNERLIHMAHKRNLILLQYPDRLDLWKLGRSESMSDGDNEILKLSKRPQHLMTLKSSQNRTIISSAISDSGEWLCYTDNKGLRLFQLNWENYDKLLPKVSLKKILITCKYDPVLKIEFTNDYLVCLGNDGKVQLLKLQLEGERKLTQMETLEMPEGLKDSYQHLMCVSNSHVAVASLEGHCTVYDINKMKYVCSLPQRETAISTMVFTPSSKQLNAFYVDRKIVEYSLETLSYTDWSRALPMDFHPQWKQRSGVVTKAFYHPEYSNRLYLQDEYSLCYIDKTLPISDKSSPLFASKKNLGKAASATLDTKKYAFHMCDRYKYLLDIDICDDGCLVVIECPPLKVLDALPPALAMKKFAT